MTRSQSNLRSFGLIVSGFLCAFCAPLSEPVFAQVAASKAGSAQQDRGEQGSRTAETQQGAATKSLDNPSLSDLYFGAPILPSNFTGPKEQATPVRAADAPPKVMKPRAKTVTKALLPQSRRKTALRLAKTTRSSSFALYKEAVRPRADAFLDQPAIRWRKCIPGIQMPLVCYLPAEDRRRIIVYPAE